MGEKREPELLLGRTVPPLGGYTPEILYPIPRAQGRRELGILEEESLPFYGADQWHAYELSWLDGAGRPRVAVARLVIPADSPCTVESKSLKLYFNGLNNSRFDSAVQLRETIGEDLSRVCGAPVELELLAPDDARLAGEAAPGSCLDDLDVAVPSGGPQAGLLATIPSGGVREERLYTHLLRSLCPVTGQPDWATLWLHYRGPALDHRALLAYLLAFRNHRGFHEQCVERIFVDILRQCGPQLLQIQGCYTRRGGLDINPLRSTEPRALPLPRLHRQ